MGNEQGTVKGHDSFRDVIHRNLSRHLSRRVAGEERIYASEDWRRSPKLRSGDEIARPREDGVTWHHGIYIGDGMVCDRTDPDPPRVITMKFFLDNQEYFDVIRYNNDSPEAREDTVTCALLACDNRYWKQEEYNLLENNCEHFSSFCRTGHKESVQVDTGLAIAIAVGLVLTGGAMAAASHKKKKKIERR
ncbi:unnamed protein product [Discosporangium mesarthrocarpum]